ncbi:MAG: hypothetical protein ING75_04275 [Rhodocyclaceae bacterium]|nr:hypothetical protein [Rhodocyclaceae bacterium]
MTTPQYHQAATRIGQSSANLQLIAGVVITLVAVSLGGCGTSQTPRRVEPPPQPRLETAATSPVRTATQQKLINEADALAPLAVTELGKKFLRATEALPAVASRTVYRDDNTREYFSPSEAAALAEERRKKLASIELDEYRFYYTKYGSPLAYLRALELASGYGLTEVGKANILDFGYGSIGHLRLLASLGANMVGVDPDSYLNALYSESSDQGSVAAAGTVYRGAAGSVTLVHGRWPATAAIAQKVAGKAPYQLIVSKNTLKRGYLKPERRAPKNQLIELGVSDDVFLKTAYNALSPGGLLVIYNLAPKQAAVDKPYLPHADARSPFSAEQFRKAGLEVVALNVEDHEFVRQMGAALGWDKNDQGEVVNDLSTNLFAIYTIVRRGSE